MSFSDMISPGKHIMLSYNSKHEDIVSKVDQNLKEYFPVWFDKNGDMKESMYGRYVHKNDCILCFLYNELHSYVVLRME